MCVYTPHAPMYNRNAVTIHQSKGLLLLYMYFFFFLSYYFFFSCSYYYLTSFSRKKKKEKNRLGYTDEFDFRISVTNDGACGARLGTRVYI